MGFDSVKIIFISKKLALLTLKKSLAFSGRFSPFISSIIALTTRRLRELYRQHSLSLGNRAFYSNPMQARALSTRALTLKIDWVGNDFNVARSFELLANHWAENTIDIVFQIRLHLVRAAANSLHPLQVAKCEKKMTLPAGKKTKTILK